MTFPASTVTLEQAWSLVRTIANKAKTAATNLSAESAAGDTVRERYVTLRNQLQSAIDNWDTLSATPGLQAYARDQINNPLLDLAAEFLAMRNAAVTLRDWIDVNLPTGTGGAVLVEQIDGTPLTFTSVQTAQFRTEANAFTATIS